MRNSLLIWCCLVIALLLPDQMFGWWDVNLPFSATSSEAGHDKIPITTIGVGICNMVNAMTSAVAEGVAVTVIAGLGVGAFLGKVSMKILLSCALGIAMLFGATQILILLGQGRVDGPDYALACGGSGMPTDMSKAGGKYHW